MKVTELVFGNGDIIMSPWGYENKSKVCIGFSNEPERNCECGEDLGQWDDSEFEKMNVIFTFLHRKSIDVLIEELEKMKEELAE